MAVVDVVVVVVVVAAVGVGDHVVGVPGAAKENKNNTDDDIRGLKGADSSAPAASVYIKNIYIDANVYIFACVCVCSYIYMLHVLLLLLTAAMLYF